MNPSCCHIFTGHRCALCGANQFEVGRADYVDRKERITVTIAHARRHTDPDCPVCLTARNPVTRGRWLAA